MRIHLDKLGVREPGEDLTAPGVIGNGRLHVDLLNIEEPAGSRVGGLAREKARREVEWSSHGQLSCSKQ